MFGLKLQKHFSEFQYKIVHSNAWIGKERFVASKSKNTFELSQLVLEEARMREFLQINL